MSIMNNIAEGFERNSDKEFKYFLYIAKGSCGEVRSMLTLAIELRYITPVVYEELHTLSTDTSRLISGLLRSFRHLT